MRRGLFLLVSVALLVGALGVGQAEAEPGCGSTLHLDYTATHDIGPCPAGGFTVGENGLTIDLNGYKIFGTGGTGDGDGITITGKTGVVVKNGTVSNFDEGIGLRSGANNNKIAGMRLFANVGDASSLTGDGVYILSSSNNTVTRSTFRSNGPFSGLYVDSASTGNRILSDRFIGNKLGVKTAAASSATVIQDSTFDGNRDVGIDLNGTGNRIRYNKIIGNGFETAGGGIAVTGDDSRITRNIIRDTAADGLWVGPGASGNVLSSNKVARSGQLGSGVDLDDATPGCTTNTWHGNVGRTYYDICVKHG